MTYDDVGNIVDFQRASARVSQLENYDKRASSVLKFIDGNEIEEDNDKDEFFDFKEINTTKKVNNLLLIPSVYSLLFVTCLDYSKQDGETIAKKGWLKTNIYGKTTTQEVMMMRYLLYCVLIFVA